MANILGNMERMKVDGAVLIEETTGQRRRISIFLLYDARRLITTGISVSGFDIQVVQTPGGQGGVLHSDPEAWSYQGQLEDGTEVVFQPVYEIPLNFTADAANKEGNDNPSIVVAYGSNGVIDYASMNFMNPSVTPHTKTIPDVQVEQGVLLVTREITSKLARIKELK